MMAQGRGSATHSVFLCFWLLCFVYAATIAEGATFVVGDHGGWTYNVVGWAKGKHFKAGDVLVRQFWGVIGQLIEMVTSFQSIEALWESRESIEKGSNLRKNGEAFSNRTDRALRVSGRERETVHVRPTYDVIGRVYCDTCRCGFETPASTYIAGAKVRVECRLRETGEVTYTVDGVTDNTGSYKIQVVDDHEDEYCESVLLWSPQSGCAVLEPGRERARVVLSHNTGIVSNKRIANNLGFQSDTTLPECAQLLAQYQEVEE
ncbi:Pollen-specific protein C13 [Acorus calamus]|uniref:Pollen-specific protein C13 n=1 Tax=Acorus calamus TaxID=4465 RepID=A0AAV9CH28_ACOCL|nr:Pollen-specific protein C13 [Acorus calamus]